MFSACLVKLHSTCPEKDFEDKYLYRKKSYFHPFRTLRGNFSIFWEEKFRQGCQNWILRAQKNNLRIFLLRKFRCRQFRTLSKKMLPFRLNFSGGLLEKIYSSKKGFFFSFLDVESKNRTFGEIFSAWLSKLHSTCPSDNQRFFKTFP